MTEKEKLMYEIMGKIYTENLPIIFKGALITKLVPTMESLVATINQSLDKLDYDLQATAYRSYGEKQSAGIKIIQTNTVDEVVRMDIDIKPIKESRSYWYGNVSFQGTMVNQILCDKLSSLSGDKIFRRIKDMVDVYALSKCISVQYQEIYDIAKMTGREIKNFEVFLSHPKEIEHAYNKFRGVERKPVFTEVYPYVKTFITPFLEKTEKHMIWSNETETWKEKEQREKRMTLEEKRELIAKRKEKNKKLLITNMSDMYLINREWFRNVLHNEEVILCYTSALECLELFVGYVGEIEIDVYAKEVGKYTNVHYHIVESFDNIETVRVGNVLCTSVNQTINDMLNDFDHTDEQALVEALSCYYFSHNNSFHGLQIEPGNVEKFNSIKDWAMEYYGITNDR